MTEELRVHPVAALFPMMTDEELDDLAADILANGLIHPIVEDPEGRLVDGRNRREACRRAGVAPIVTTLAQGEDPVQYILGANVMRRHLSKPQLAVLVLRSRNLETSQDYHWGEKDLARTYGLPAEYLSMAACVLEYTPELGDGILVNRLSLEKAYAQARARKLEVEGEEEANRRAADALAELRGVAPDLAALVDENRMELAEAQGAYEARLRERAALIRVRTGNLVQALGLLVPAVSVENWASYMSDWWKFVDRDQLDLDAIGRALVFLAHVEEELHDGTHANSAD